MASVFTWKMHGYCKRVPARVQLITDAYCDKLPRDRQSPAFCENSLRFATGAVCLVEPGVRGKGLAACIETQSRNARQRICHKLWQG